MEEPIDLMNEFLESIVYVGDVRPWQEVPETEASEDEPGGDLTTLGGPGSGNFGHSGRPGAVGGSGGGFSVGMPPTKFTQVMGGEIDDTPLARYVGGNSFEYQESLRYGHPLNSEEERDVAELDKMIAESVSKTNLVVYRTVPPEIAAELRPGQIIKDKGFVSTSIKPDIKDEMLDADVAGAKLPHAEKAATEAKLQAIKGYAESGQFKQRQQDFWNADTTLVKRALGARPETIVHQAADAHLAKMSVAVRYAFARGRKAINKTALRDALKSLRAAGGPGSGRYPKGSGQDHDGIIQGEDGTPLMLYHGSTAKGMTASTLDPNAPRVRAQTTPMGVAFTSDERVAYGYARTPGHGGKFGSVVKANLAMENPLDITKDIKDGQKRGLSFGDAKREALTKVTSEHDGVIFRGDSYNSDEYVVFSKHQIREPLRAASAPDLESLLSSVPDAIRAALEEVLPGTLLKIFAAGGEAGLTLLKKQLRVAGGPGSGRYPKGSGDNSPLFGETPGAHSKAAAERLVSYLEKETGLSLKLHGSLGKGAESSPNDIDIAIVDPTFKMSAEEKDAWHKQATEDANKAEDEIWNTLPHDEAMNKLYGDVGNDPLNEALSKIGFEPVRTMSWEGTNVTRFRNETTNHTIEIWEADEDSGDAENGPPIPSARDLENAWVIRTAKRPPLVKKIDHTTIRFDVKNQRASDWADRHAAELIDGITETTREDISNAIAESFETGDLGAAYEVILDAVGNERRAELISRTETMMAANAGQRESWSQAVEVGLLDGDEKREWIATADVSCCDSCDELNGKLADLGGKYPDPGGDGPPLHPRCRCTEGISA